MPWGSEEIALEPTLFAIRTELLCKLHAPCVILGLISTSFAKGVKARETQHVQRTRPHSVKSALNSPPVDAHERTRDYLSEAEFHVLLQGTRGSRRRRSRPRNRHSRLRRPPSHRAWLRPWAPNTC